MRNLDQGVQLLGIVLQSDRNQRRVAALTPQGLWNFSHSSPSRRESPKAKVIASALNPLCLSQFTFISRERGWGYLQGALLQEVLWPDLGKMSATSPQQRQQVLDSLKVSGRLRRLILLTQQPASESPLLFHLLLSCLRRLLEGTSPHLILGVFGVKFLMHEGRWPARPECLGCCETILGQPALLGAMGFLCLKCQRDPNHFFGGVHFAGHETEQLCGIGLHRQWDELQKLDIDAVLGDKIADAAEMISTSSG